MVHRSELSGLINKEKTHSSENAQEQGLKMREKAENIQRKTLKELQKAGELLITHQDVEKAHKIKNFLQLLETTVFFLPVNQNKHLLMQ